METDSDESMAPDTVKSAAAVPEQESDVSENAVDGKRPSRAKNKNESIERQEDATEPMPKPAIFDSSQDDARTKEGSPPIVSSTCDKVNTFLRKLLQFDGKSCAGSAPICISLVVSNMIS